MRERLPRLGAHFWLDLVFGRGARCYGRGAVQAAHGRRLSCAHAEGDRGAACQAHDVHRSYTRLELALAAGLLVGLMGLCGQGNLAQAVTAASMERRPGPEYAFCDPLLSDALPRVGDGQVASLLACRPSLRRRLLLLLLPGRRAPALRVTDGARRTSGCSRT